jgi:DNA-directed RNA polymerase subunit RPC12/RpoP
MPSQNCKKCGHAWQSIKDKPLKCPACNQPNYWKAKVRNVAQARKVKSGLCEHGADPKFCRLGTCPEKQTKGDK